MSQRVQFGDPGFGFNIQWYTKKVHQICGPLSGPSQTVKGLWSYDILDPRTTDDRKLSLNDGLKMI